MKQYILLFGIFLLFACQPRLKNKRVESLTYLELRKAGWLLGCWQIESSKGILTESWQQKDDSTFAGRSFFVSKGDTVSLESIRLEQRRGKLYYIPTVPDQNEGKPVVFVQTSLTDSTVVFENPKHDFPQKITYSFLVNDSLSVEIAAIVDGKQKARTFRMGKVK